MILKPGDRVIVDIQSYDADDATTAKLARMYNGKIMTITRKRTVRPNLMSYVELDGAISDKGIPYSFLVKWVKEA